MLIELLAHIAIWDSKRKEKYSQIKWKQNKDKP